MPSNAFTHFVLRTQGVDSARAFYAAVLGHTRMNIVPLHEQAIARGARPHWLGQVEVEDVESTSRAFIAKGAQALGPIGTFPDGRTFAVMRDAGGAIVGLTSEAPSEARDVAWVQLNTPDLAVAMEAYGALFGWRFTGEETHPEHGKMRHFAYAEGAALAGTLVDIAGKKERHPHWLFHLHTTDLDRAMETVRSLKGIVYGPFALPSGERVAVCDDPEGAAFALRG